MTTQAIIIDHTGHDHTGHDHTGADRTGHDHTGHDLKRVFKVSQRRFRGIMMIMILLKGHADTY